MQKVEIKRPAIKLIGISVRTNNERERDRMNGLIFPCIKKYFHGGVIDQIPHRKNPGTTFCAYTEYESDHTGDYTYFVGEEVTSLDVQLPEGFVSLVIPEQNYMKFTTSPAPMPDVIINAWKEIWNMDLQRRYHTDFEIYDERAADHHNIIMDLYIGIES